MKSSLRIVILGTAVVAAVVAGVSGWYAMSGRLPWQPAAAAPLVTRLDGSRGRVFSVDAETGGTFQVRDLRGVRVTLEIQPDSLAKDTELTVAPLVPESGVVAGVSISPASTTFAQPVILSFAYGDAPLRNADAPTHAGTPVVRATGASQVLAVGAEGMAVPVLVPRSAETADYLPAFIRGGGTYAVVINAADRLAYARAGVDSSSRGAILEGAAVLVDAGERLTGDQKAQIRAAVASAKNAAQPTAIEQFAAQVVGRAAASVSLVPVARAEVFSGFYETRCKDRTLSLPEYLAAAQTAQMLGLEEQGNGCIEAAKTVVATQARAVLSDPNASIAEILNQIQRLQILGADEETDVDERLQARVERIVEDDAGKVARSSEATKTDAAIALQRLQALGVENASLEERLVKKMEDAPSGEARVVADVGEAGSNEDLIPGFDLSLVGLALMEGLGVGPDSFDQQGIQAWTDELYAQKDLMIEFADSTCAAIVELGGTPPPECAGVEAKLEGLYQDLRREGYRAADEVGDIQSSDYQEFTGDEAVPPESEPEMGEEDEDELPIEDPCDYADCSGSDAPSEEPEDELPLEPVE